MFQMNHSATFWVLYFPYVTLSEQPTTNSIGVVQNALGGLWDVSAAIAFLPRTRNAAPKIPPATSEGEKVSPPVFLPSCTP